MTSAYQLPPPLTAEEERQILNGTWQGRGVAPKFPPGVRQADGLTRHIKTDITGRQITEYTGDPRCWMEQFMGPALQQVRIYKRPGNYAGAEVIKG